LLSLRTSTTNNLPSPMINSLQLFSSFVLAPTGAEFEKMKYSEALKKRFSHNMIDRGAFRVNMCVRGWWEAYLADCQQSRKTTVTSSINKAWSKAVGTFRFFNRSSPMTLSSSCMPALIEEGDALCMEKK
jgi:O-methyltransferase involved in polyketide biosynthesis